MRINTADWPLSESNRYSFWEMDFESIASANSAKRPAFLPGNILLFSAIPQFPS